MSPNERLSSRLTVATRANVPPFHVMDLLAAANLRAAEHGDLLNLVAGQPSTPAPAAVRRAAAAALDGDLLGYTVALGIPELREAIAAHHKRFHGIDVSTDDVVVTTGSSGGFLLAFLAAFESGRPGGDRAAGLPLLPQRADRSGLRGGRASDRTPGPLPADRRDARGSRRADQGTRRRVTRQPHRHDAAPRGAGSTREVVRGERRAADQRRDLPRHLLRRRTRAQQRLGDQPRGSGVQLVLEVLLHDRLAHRLDARARATASCGRRADRQLHDLPAHDLAACRHRGVHGRVVRRVRRERRALRDQPSTAPAKGCPSWASTSWRRQTVRSTSTPT